MGSGPDYRGSSSSTSSASCCVALNARKSVGTRPSRPWTQNHFAVRQMSETKLCVFSYIVMATSGCGLTLSASAHMQSTLLGGLQPKTRFKKPCVVTSQRQISAEGQCPSRPPSDEMPVRSRLLSVLAIAGAAEGQRARKLGGRMAPSCGIADAADVTQRTLSTSLRSEECRRDAARSARSMRPQFPDGVQFIQCLGGSIVETDKMRRPLSDSVFARDASMAWQRKQELPICILSVPSCRLNGAR